MFSPLEQLGLIVIDEEQEHTYHSENSPRYDAREVARRRAAAHGALLVLASATPSVESFYAARAGRMQLVQLLHRYNDMPLPKVYMAEDVYKRQELFCLERAVKIKFLEEMSLAAQAVSAAFGAEKMNCELLGNGDAHLHWHLFPRVAGDLEGFGSNGKGPVWWYPAQKMYSDAARPAAAELEQMKARLRAELLRLL